MVTNFNIDTVYSSLPRVVGIALLVAFLPLALLGCGDDSAPTEPEEPGEPDGPDEITLTVEGEVSDGGSGDPVAGASVAVYEAGAEEALDTGETGAEGAYELSLTAAEDEAPDELRFEADADDYELYEATLNVTTGTMSLTHDAELEPVTAEANLAGTITDADTGDPIEGAAATGTRDDTGEELFAAETDAFGEYEASFTVDDPPDQVTVEAEADGYESGAETVPFEENMTADLVLSPTGEPTTNIDFYVGLQSKVQALTEDAEPVWEYEHNDGVAVRLAADAEGHAYVGTSEGTVHRVDPEGDQVWTYDGHDDNIRSLTVDDEGNVYTASSDGETHKIDSTGERVWVYSGYEGGPLGVAVDLDGFVYGSGAGADSKVHKIDPDGAPVWQYDELPGNISEIAVDADGYVYSAAWQKEGGETVGVVDKISADGEQVWRYEEHTHGVGPYDIAVDADGYVYSSTTDGDGGLNTPEVDKISPQGEQVWRYAESHDDTIHDVAVGPEGFVYTLSIDGVDILSPDGLSMLKHSPTHLGLAVIPGEFRVSQGLVD